MHSGRGRSRRLAQLLLPGGLLGSQPPASAPEGPERRALAVNLVHVRGLAGLEARRCLPQLSRESILGKPSVALRCTRNLEAQRQLRRWSQALGLRNGAPRLTGVLAGRESALRRGLLLPGPASLGGESLRLKD